MRIRKENRLAVWLIRKLSYWNWYHEYRERGYTEEQARLKAQWRSQ
jgi:hypothetical protein